MSTEKDKKSVYYSRESKQQFLTLLLNSLPESESLLFGEDDLTTEMTRDICAEIVREKCFEVLHQEIPYQLAVETHKFDENNPKQLNLEFTIIVGKDSHKKIVIGKGGETIKQIGMLSRKDIEEFVQRKVFMQTNVIVKENWYENNLMLKDLKYDILDTNASVLAIINKYKLKTTDKILTEDNIAYTNSKCNEVSKQVKKC